MNGAVVPAGYIPLYARYSMPGPGFEDEDSELYFEFTLTGFQQLLGQILRVPPDGDFYWRGYISTAINSGGGDVKLRFHDGYGNPLQTSDPATLLPNTFIESLGGFDGGARAAPKFPEIGVPANGFLKADLVEYLGAAATVQLILVGVTRYRI